MRIKLFLDVDSTLLDTDYHGDPYLYPSLFYPGAEKFLHFLDEQALNYKIETIWFTAWSCHSLHGYRCTEDDQPQPPSFLIELFHKWPHVYGGGKSPELIIPYLQLWRNNVDPVRFIVVDDSITDEMVEFSTANNGIIFKARFTADTSEAWFGNVTTILRAMIEKGD